MLNVRISLGKYRSLRKRYRDLMIKWSATARKPDVSVGEQEEKHDRNDKKSKSTNYIYFLSKKLRKLP